MKKTKEFLITMLIIFITDSMFFKLNKNLSIINFSKIFIVIFAFLTSVYIIMKNKKLSKRSLYFIFVIIFIQLLSEIINGLKMDTFVLSVSTLLLGMNLTCLIEFSTFKERYIQILAIIAIISLIGYYFPQFLTNFKVHTIITSTRNEYFDGYLFTNIPRLIWLRKRNWGPFWEPGVYQIYLNLSLLFILTSYRLSYKRFLIILFAVTLYTTKSTAGYINFIFMCIFYLKKQFRTQNVKLIIIYIFSFFIIIFLLIKDPEVLSVLYKLEGLETESRFLSILFGKYVLLNKPFFGIGYRGISENHLLLSKSFSMTNTWVYLLVSNGIINLIIYINQMYRTSLTISKENGKIMLFLIILFFSSQTLNLSLLFNYLLFINQEVYVK